MRGHQSDIGGELDQLICIIRIKCTWLCIFLKTMNPDVNYCKILIFREIIIRIFQLTIYILTMGDISNKKLSQMSLEKWMLFNPVSNNSQQNSWRNSTEFVTFLLAITDSYSSLFLLCKNVIFNTMDFKKHAIDQKNQITSIYSAESDEIVSDSATLTGIRRQCTSRAVSQPPCNNVQLSKNVALYVSVI